MYIRIPLDEIQPNPFQKRFDYGGIEELASSIRAMLGARPETSGLLQVPPARLWDVGAGQPLSLAHLGDADEILGLLNAELQVQLAAGHRRLAAFRRLRGGELGTPVDVEYATFPVELQVLSDEQMIDVAWVENAERLDPNPIEEALMLQDAMERFEWTQEQVAKRWRLSRSGVANKIRLLKLPEDAQGALRRGEIGERHGRLLLSAMGKSPVVFEQFKAEVLPAAKPEADVLRKARREADQFARSYANMVIGNSKCVACGEPIVPTNHQVYRHYENGGYVFMCTACYRAVTGWMPPSSTEANKILEGTILNHRKRLADAGFPLDVVVGQGDPAIHTDKCVECAYRDADGVFCLDSGCAATKAEYWKSYQNTTFLERVRIQFGTIAPIVEGYGGVDLSSYNEIDVAMVRDGTCAPGKCERLRFRRVFSARGYIRPFEDLLYVYNCNHSSSHKACQRRWLAAQRTEDEVEAEQLAVRIGRRNQGQARLIEARAIEAVAEALQGGNATTWRRLARKFDSEADQGGLAIEGFVAIVAREVFGNPTEHCGDWGAEDTLELAQELIAERMQFLGVKLPETTDDVVKRIERIEGFVLDEDGQVRGDLTQAQIEGNLDNLEKLERKLGDAHNKRTLSDADFERIVVQVRWLHEHVAAKRDGAVEDVDEGQLEMICNTSVEYARSYIEDANAATLQAALERERSSGKARGTLVQHLEREIGRREMEAASG